MTVILTLLLIVILMLIVMGIVILTLMMIMLMLLLRSIMMLMLTFMLNPLKASRNLSHGFVAYSDSSWGNEYPYPMFGYGVYLYGGLISFSTKQLKVVAFSSCEAEYAASSYACKEVEFIRNICADLSLMLQGRLVLALDNSACIDIAFDVGVSGRTKHFDRAIHYLRDLTQMRRMLPAFVSTDMQKADGFTKALNKSKFLQWLPCVMSKA